ncbi:hypothetical protein [Streptomyces sp. F001]|uniref:hypothetical protein n=1 Tax=Streptomyces sp. F001 TaxID=1510026 RepID=UPI0019D11C9C|nr:hypothetical protein [Streptomyces sp. F001]
MFAVEYEARLAGLAHHLGTLAEAERALKAALEHGDRTWRRPAGPAAPAARRGPRGSDESAGRRARSGGSTLADEAGEARRSAPGPGTARPGSCCGRAVRRGRRVLESALLDLTAETHGDARSSRPSGGSATASASSGAPRLRRARLQAARSPALAEQQDHATLAHLAAESLGQAGLPTEADRAYARGRPVRSLGNVHGLVRSLRARAWLACARRTARTRTGADDARPR